MSKSVRLVLSVVCGLGFAAALVAWSHARRDERSWSAVAVVDKPFQLHFSAMGTISPHNRVVVTAPVGGRVDKILSQEGETVKSGQVMAEVSSTDRVALMEAARQSGSDPEMKNLLGMYKATPIRSPLAGRILVKSLSLGQTVTTDASLYEICDELIVVSKVDEADIGSVKIHQQAFVHVDAFPDQLIEARVDRVGEQSSSNNGVTSYDVFLSPVRPLADNLKSGMSVKVDFTIRSENRALVLPVWIAQGRKNTEMTLRVRAGDGSVSERAVRLGQSNGELVEILAGLSIGDSVLYQNETGDDDKKGVPFGLMGTEKK